jgi:hypothetical protein
VAKHLISFNRSPTWITPEFAAEFAPEGRDTKFSDKQKASWAADPNAFLKYRKNVEATMNHFFDLQYKDSQAQKDSFNQFHDTMRNRLKSKDGLSEKLVPEFAVGCRRYVTISDEKEEKMFSIRK